MGKILKDTSQKNKHMERSSISLVTREMQIKTTMRYHVTSIRKKLKELIRPNIGKDVEQLEHSHIAGDRVKQ